MEEDLAHLAPTAPRPLRSSESRCKRMRTPAQPRGVIPGNLNKPSSAATPSGDASGATSISVDKELLEILSEGAVEKEDEEENSFDHDDELSVSLPSADGATQEGDGEKVSKANKGKRGGKRSKPSVQLSPSHSKASRVKRADCWKYFRVINVASKNSLGLQ
ncbi:uncharacterized protein C2845_PM01G46030 [Panicum miliaceum]|uniref:Uncharacterized protein n=1 Tax=Panicum miliaceum TaxID=4540 RepID=A0A3L6TGA5_PANMI|nr:uncharacterized protein C2845_PM01G46030 [Panicum miliaceum]